MSGTSAFLRRSCWAKYGKGLQFPHNPIWKSAILRNWYEDQKNFVDWRVCFGKQFLIISLLSESIWYMGFRSTWYFGSSFFVTAWVFKFCCCTQKHEREQTAIHQEKWIMTGGVTTFTHCRFLSDARPSLLCFQVILFRRSNRSLFWKVVTWYLFLLCRFLLRRFTMHSQRNRINSFGHDWKRRLFHLWENDCKIWRTEKFCVFFVQKCWLFQPIRKKEFEGLYPVLVQ